MSTVEVEKGLCLKCNHETAHCITIGVRSKDVAKRMKKNIRKFYICKGCNNARTTGIRSFLRQHGIY